MMKREKFALIYTVVLISFLGCSSGEPEPQLTEEEKQVGRLARTWVLGTITYGDDEITERFDDFTLTFTKEKTYTVTGSLGDYDYEPFKRSGTWDFKGTNLNILGRDDGVEMSVQVDDKALLLMFTITEENGRIAGLGSYRFALVN